jgi:hypothetical protein
VHYCDYSTVKMSKLQIKALNLLEFNWQRRGREGAGEGGGEYRANVVVGKRLCGISSGVFGNCDCSI